MQTQIVYEDEAVLVIRKPAGLATESAGIGQKDVVSELKNYVAKKNPGKMPYLGVVHRLDQPVEGLLVFAKTKKAAENLTAQLGKGTLKKEYLAVVHGVPEGDKGTLTDLLYRDKARRMTMVAEAPGKGVQEAVLDYEVLSRAENLSKVRIHLRTGRTHQIRVQFASRGMPLVGERKYSTLEDPCEIALWSHKIGFTHPVTGKFMTFSQEPPKVYPWSIIA